MGFPSTSRRVQVDATRRPFSPRRRDAGSHMIVG
jgi:hypothetical protein